MQTNWAEENLQTIRTLMERTAVYRRALAPIVIFAGIMGIVAAAAGMALHLDSPTAFGILWFGTAAVIVAGAFFNTRRQAIRDKEAVWSPPTRRVAQALLPPFTIGFALGILGLWADVVLFLPLLWAMFYGLALHSAGFFVARGMKWLGWGYIVLGLGSIVTLPVFNWLENINAHLLMGLFFGPPHLAYGAYLYLAEKRKTAA